MKREFPNLFQDSTRILVVNDESVSEKLRRHYKPPDCLNWNDVPATIESAFFFPNPEIPAGANLAHVRKSDFFAMFFAHALAAIAGLWVFFYLLYSIRGRENLVTMAAV